MPSLSKVKIKDLTPFLDNIETCCPTLGKEIVQLSLLLPSLLAMKPPEKPLWIECIPFDELKHYRQHSLDELLGPPPQAIPQPAVAHIG